MDDFVWDMGDVSYCFVVGGGKDREEMSDKTEQWKLDGDCSLCRRKNYCSNRCTRNKMKLEMLVRSLVANELEEMTSDVFSELNRRLTE